VRLEGAIVHGAEHTTDFQKPLTVGALARFDPDLVLVFNRELQVYQVMRRAERSEQWAEPRLVWICDWTEGLDGSDNPESLIAYLRAGDTGPTRADAERIEREGTERALEHAERVQRFIDDEWKHFRRDNRRQLAKYFRPLVDSPTFVR
jgi:hypothetical protein